MEGYLRKYGWAIQLGFVIIVATLLAFIASGIVAVYLAPYRVPDVDLSHVSAPAQNDHQSDTPSAVEMARVIDDRCLFGGCPEKEDPNVCSPPCPEGEICSQGKCIPSPDDGNDENQGDGLPVESDSGVKVLGIVVASNPRYSTAVLQSPGAPVSSIVGVGDQIAGREVKEIYRDRIILSNGGKLEFVRLDNTLQGNPTAGRTIGTIANRPNTDKVAAVLKDDESKKALLDAVAAAAPPVAAAAPPPPSNTITIDRNDIRDTFRDPVALVQDAQIIPHYENGQASGVKVNKVPGGLQKFGIHSGDVVTKINGKTITTQISAFDALKSVQNAKSLEIVVNRNGKTESLNYTIK